MRLILRITLAVLITLTSVGHIEARYHYMSASTGFLPFTTDSILTLHADTIVADISIDTSSFTISTAITNISTISGQPQNYSWFINDNDGRALTINISSFEADKTDNISTPYTLITITSDTDSLPLFSKKLDVREFHSRYKPNQLNIKRNDNQITVSLGPNSKTTIFSSSRPLLGNIISVGFSASAQTTIKISHIAIRTPDIHISTPCYTSAQIDSITTTTHNPREGKWALLDYSTDDSCLRIGGRYRIAIISDPDSKGHYDILYLSGAEISPGNWLPGMVKGHLKPTSLPSLFSLQWYDSEGRQLSRDATLQFDATNHTFTITLPSASSTIRFHKIPQR